MRTVTSALFLALCILFAATYATAARDVITRRDLDILMKKIRDRQARMSLSDRAHTGFKPPVYTTFPTVRKNLPFADRQIMYEPAPFRPYPSGKQGFWLSDAEFAPSGGPGRFKFHVLPRRPGTIVYSDSEIVAPSGPHRPWDRRHGPIVYSDESVMIPRDWLRRRLPPVPKYELSSEYYKRPVYRPSEWGSSPRPTY